MAAASDHAQEIAQLIRPVLTVLGHDAADDRVRKVVRFRLIEGQDEGG